MTLKVRWTTRAADQLVDGATYIEARRPGAGVKLIGQVEAAVSAASENPRMFPRVPDTEGEVRRALIRRYGYWVVYEIAPRDVLVILAVWHGARAPSGWRQH